MSERHPIDIKMVKDAELDASKIRVTEMPDRETLEEFLRGMHRSPKVTFNAEEGKFVWSRPRPKSEDD